MYIRRKVFSLLIDEATGEERWFSTTEIEDSRLFSDDEKKMRRGDRQNIERLKKMYKKDESIKEAHKKQYDDDPEVRKQGDREVMKKGMKSVAKTTGVLVPASAALGYGMSRGILKEGRKEAAKTGGKMALISAGSAAVGAGIGAGALALDNKMRNKRVNEGKLSEADKKVKDQIRTASGEMTEEEYTNKWGKTKKKK